MEKIKHIPTFFVSEEYSGCTLREFIEYAIANDDEQRFSPKIHRNQGYKGKGSCLVEGCEVCLIMKDNGV